MSIYILIDYINYCKESSIEPSFPGLHKWKNDMSFKKVDC